MSSLMQMVRNVHFALANSKSWFGKNKNNDQLLLEGKNMNVEQLNLIVGANMAILTQQIGALQNGVMTTDQ